MRTATLSSGVEINSVLRSTYLLLSMTLVWSAFTAYLGTQVAFSLPLFLGAVIGGFIALFATLALRNSGWGLVGIFAFTGLEGFTLGPVLSHYLGMANGGTIVATAAGLTAAVFLALSFYALVSRKDFSFLGGMLFVGLIALLLASLVALFFPIPALHLTLSVIGVLIFSGYVLYDTSEIIRGGETSCIVATVSLYLDILNLFLNLLRIVGFLSGDD